MIFVRAGFCKWIREKCSAGEFIVKIEVEIGEIGEKRCFPVKEQVSSVGFV